APAQQHQCRLATAARGAMRSEVRRGDSRAASCRVPRFGEGDLPRAHPAQYGVGRDGGRKLVVVPRRGAAELVLEFVRSPAFLVTAGLLDRAQLPKEENAIVLSVDRNLRLAADDKPKLAVLEVNGSRASLRLPSASTAWRGDHYGLAGGA